MQASIRLLKVNLVFTADDKVDETRQRGWIGEEDEHGAAECRQGPNVINASGHSRRRLANRPPANYPISGPAPLTNHWELATPQHLQATFILRPAHA